MPISYQIAVLIHVLAAVVWVGGVLFMGLVAIPASRSMSRDRGREMVRRLGRYFRPVGWTALSVLVATGLYQAWTWGARPETIWDGSFFAAARAKVLGLKVLLVVLMAVSSGLHDWYVGPRAVELAERNDESAETWRRVSAFLGAITALLAIGIVVLGSIVSRAWVISLGL